MRAPLLKPDISVMLPKILQKSDVFSTYGVRGDSKTEMLKYCVDRHRAGVTNETRSCEIILRMSKEIGGEYLYGFRVYGGDFEITIPPKYSYLS